MDNFEMETINEEFVEFGINQSLLPPQRKPNSVDFTETLDAIEKGDLWSLQQASPPQSCFRETDPRGWLLLHSAAVQPQACVLQRVLELQAHSGLTLEELTGNGDTPLILAVQAGLVENVKLLLKHNVSPQNTNNRNESPLLLAVRQKSYEMSLILLMGGAFVEQVCLKKWTALHEAAKVGCPSTLMLLLRHGAKVTSRDGHGVTPLGIAAEHGNTEVLEVLIQHGGDVNAQATNGDTVLYDASGSGNLDCVELLLKHGADPDVQSNAFQLPVHRAAYEGHILALRALLPVTSLRAIRRSGHSPVHAAADGGQQQCLQLLLDHGLNVNELLQEHISQNYVDLRRSALFFAVCNGDTRCSQTLLQAGASCDADPLRCVLVAVRAQRYDLVRLLLAHGADVNCYFNVISPSVFPTALQYCLSDPAMTRILLNHGYDARKCFQCCHGDGEELDGSWAELHNQVYQIYSEPDAAAFCDFVSVSWLKRSTVGRLVRTLLDYVSHVTLCPRLQRLLQDAPEWEEICALLRSPRSLLHSCRLIVRSHIPLKKLNHPGFLSEAALPPRVRSYLTFQEYDL